MAAALAGSDVPQKCVEMEQFNLKVDTGEKKILNLKLVLSGDGQFNCALSCDDCSGKRKYKQYKLSFLIPL